MNGVVDLWRNILVTEVPDLQEVINQLLSFDLAVDDIRRRVLNLILNHHFEDEDDVLYEHHKHQEFSEIPRLFRDVLDACVVAAFVLAHHEHLLVDFGGEVDHRAVGHYRHLGQSF